MYEDEDLSKKIIITWGFNSEDGKLYLDSYLELVGEEKDLVKTVHIMELRQRFQMTHMTLLHTPEDTTREDIENYIKHTPKKEVIKKLKDGEVKVSAITRKDSGSTAIEFIKDLNNPTKGSSTQAKKKP